MNIFDELKVIRGQNSHTLIVPFIFSKNQNGATHIPLQFDKDGLNLHSKLSVENYGSAVVVEVFKDRQEKVFMPLVLAVKNNPDDVVIGCDFEGGKLWGWFPKECAV